jgi:hypothetical protein
MVRNIIADLERRHGRPLVVVPLGKVLIAPCGCKMCRMRAKAAFN